MDSYQTDDELQEKAYAHFDEGKVEDAFKYLAQVACPRTQDWIRRSFVCSLSERGYMPQAYELAQEIDTREERDDALLNIGLQYIHDHKVGDALDIVEEIEEAPRKDALLVQIVQKELVYGKYATALKLAEKIEDEWEHSSALAECAIAHARATKFDELLPILPCIMRREQNDYARTTIAGQLITNGTIDPDYILSLIQGIQDQNSRERVYCDLIEYYVRATAPADALEVVSRIIGKRQHDEGLLAVIRFYAEIHNFSVVFSLVKQLTFYESKENAVRLIAEPLLAVGAAEELLMALEQISVACVACERSD